MYLSFTLKIKLNFAKSARIGKKGEGPEIDISLRKGMEVFEISGIPSNNYLVHFGNFMAPLRLLNTY